MKASSTTSEVKFEPATFATEALKQREEAFAALAFATVVWSADDASPLKRN
jgi:hypothetical protein